MRERFLLYIGTIGGAISAALGGWDFALQTMLGFMVIDYATGWIVAGVFKKSLKTECGALKSHIGYKGFIKKCMMLIMVYMGVRLDLLIGWDFVRYGIIIAIIANETVSIVENFGLMGVPIPPALKQAIDILKKKEGDDNGA